MFLYSFTSILIKVSRPQFFPQNISRPAGPNRWNRKLQLSAGASDYYIKTNSLGHPTITPKNDIVADCEITGSYL